MSIFRPREQDCAPGHYRAADDSCRRCPCSGNEVSCELDDNGAVTCECRPNYGGSRCEIGGTCAAESAAQYR